MTCSMHFPAETFICLKCAVWLEIFIFFLLFIFCSCFNLYMCFGCATQVPVLVRGVQLQCIEFWLFDGYNSMKSDENFP